MDMRDCLTAIESFLVVVGQEPEDREKVVIVESAVVPAGALFVGYIDEWGVQIDPTKLTEGLEHAPPSIMIEAHGDEFVATWEAQPTRAALDRLSTLVEAWDEFPAYTIGRMIYPTKRNAAACLKSLLGDS